MSSSQQQKQKNVVTYALDEHAATVAAGAFAGLVSTLVTNPFDILRTRQSASRKATGGAERTMVYHVKQMYRDGAILALTTGLFVNILSSIPSNAIYLSTYNQLKKFTTAHYGEDSHVATIVSSTGAVCAVNGSLGPLFTLKTRSMLDNHHTVLYLAKDIMRRDGFAGFYRGSATNTAGRIVEEGIFWLLYEQAKRITEEGTFHNRNFLWGSFTVVSLSSVCKMIGASLAYPYNVVMTHLREVNKETGLHDHKHFMPTVAKIYKSDGFFGFYRGLTPQVLRSMLSKGSQLYCYELFMFVYALRYYEQQKTV